MEKKCRRCNITKRNELFSKCKQNKDRISNWCKECFSKYNKTRYQNNDFKINHNIIAKNWYLNNLEKAKFQNIEWIGNNRDKYNIHHNKRYKNDLIYKLKKILRAKLNSSLKSQKTNKNNSSIILLGCTIEELKLHLEQQFKPEMNWSNHGEIWEIDHIKACDNYNLTQLEEQKECFHYSNLQPLFSTSGIAESYGYKGYIGNRNKSNK